MLYFILMGTTRIFHCKEFPLHIFLFLKERKCFPLCVVMTLVSQQVSLFHLIQLIPSTLNAVRAVDPPQSCRSTSVTPDSNIGLVHCYAANVASGRKFWEGKTSNLMVHQRFYLLSTVVPLCGSWRKAMSTVGSVPARWGKPAKCLHLQMDSTVYDF